MPPLRPAPLFSLLVLLSSAAPALAQTLPDCPQVCPLGQGEQTATPTASSGPGGWIYAYAASGSVSAIPTWPWDSVTHVALAGVEIQPDGSIRTPADFSAATTAALAAASPHGVRVHVNLYTPHPSLLDDPTAIQRAATEAASLLTRHGLQGVSIDVEGLSRATGPKLTPLIQAIGAVSPQTVVAAPAAFLTDMGATSWAEHADALMVMAYQYYGNHGPAPISPRQASPTWPGGFGTEQSVACYLCRGVSPDKLVLGLPLYGGHWSQTDNQVPSDKKSSKVHFVDFGCLVADAEGVEGGIDEASGTPYFFPDPTSQAWYDTVASLTAKMSPVREHGLKGVGFWQLANAATCQNEPYQRLWAAVAEQVRPPQSTDSTPAAPEGPEEERGCGCATAIHRLTAGPASLLAALWLLAVRRRR